MLKASRMLWTVLVSSLIFFAQCKTEEPIIIPIEEGNDPPEGFLFGADLSYVNQILDYNGVYREDGVEKDPYAIFKDNGTNLVRLRIWNDPQWTKEVYGPNASQLYNDLYDVERAIRKVKANNMTTLLDFHYSDNWADPGKQRIPLAWRNIKDIEVLKDSIYNFTYETLSYLDGKGLMPEYVQIGNETNCGMLYSDALAGFPACNGCDGQWSNLRAVVNSAIKAVRDVSANSSVSTKIMLHVADAKNVEWWFDNLINGTSVTDFEIIGFSYYPIWHTTVPLNQISNKIASFKSKFNKDIIILETAYPWTTANNDSYANIFGSNTQLPDYPFTPDSQERIIKLINQEVIDGGGIGTVYWEPGWITSDLRDQWGQGSSWENNAFFDYDGNLNSAIDYMTERYN